MTNIALVDDESNILTSVSLALETEGFNVDTFKNGEEAIRALESKKYDLGLFDIKMPRMNGNELLMKVRSFYEKLLQCCDRFIGYNKRSNKRGTRRAGEKKETVFFSFCLSVKEFDRGYLLYSG